MEAPEVIVEVQLQGQEQHERRHREESLQEEGGVVG